MPVLRCFVVIAIVALGSAAAVAQPYTVRPGYSYPARPAPARTAPANQSKTSLSVELLVDRQGGALQVHEWNTIFRDLGVSVRVRQGTAGEKLGVTEQTAGPLREVRIVGRLDRSGRIVLPDRTFSPADGPKLGEWLRELQTFGAQGSPDGKPLWGLSKTQFGQVYSALGSKAVEGTTAGQSLAEALQTLRLPAQYPLRWTADAADWLRRDVPPGRKARQDVQGLSHGTALALLLNDFGLGFAPSRTPAGTLELAIEPLHKKPNVWPVGWEPKGTPYQTAPKLFQLVPVELTDAPLLDVLEAVSQKSEVPVRFDHYLIEKHKIDLETIRVSHPPKKTSWSLLVRGVTNPHRLTYELRIDEQGHPFVWITTLKLGTQGQ